MPSFFSTLLNQSFLQIALAGGLLSGLICSLVGPLVQVRKLGNVAGGIAHGVLGGMGLAQWLGGDPFVGAVIASILAAMAIAFVSLNYKDKQESIISAIWSVGMASGLLFLRHSPGYAVDLTSYLFGDLLILDAQALIEMSVFAGIIFLSITVFYQKFEAISFDERWASLRGVPVETLTYFLYILIALSIIVLIRSVGLILVIAWLSLPPAIVTPYSQNLMGMMARSLILNISTCILAFIIAFECDQPIGNWIILLIGCVFGIQFVFSTIIKKN